MATSLRIPQLDVQALLAQPNPRIDLHLESFDKSTQNFLKAVANYKRRAIATLSERRDQQAAAKKKLLDKCQTVQAETNQCKLKELEICAQLEREKEERQEAELAVAGYKRRLSSLKDRLSELDSEIEQHRAIVANLQREKGTERVTLNSFAARAVPDLAVCEKYLGCLFEGIENDRILIRFYHINPADQEQDCSLVLDVTSTLYKVMTSSPTLPSMPILVDTLNTSRDLFNFIIQVRAAFKAVYHTVL